MSTKTDPESHESDIEIPRQSVLQLLPRRGLWKALAMLVMLVLIILLQRRADVVVRQVGGLTGDPSGATTPSAPEGKR